jgi:hypothetical protein
VIGRIFAVYHAGCALRRVGACGYSRRSSGVLRVDSAQKSRGGRLADTPAVCCLIFHSVTTGTMGGSG